MLSFLERDLFAYLSSCGPRGQSSNLTHISGDQGVWWHHLHTLRLTLGFWYLLERSTCLVAQLSWLPPRVHPLQAWLWWSAELTFMGSYRTATVFNLLPSALAEDWSAWESQWVPSSYAPHRLPVSLRKELLHRSGVLTFIADVQRINFLLCLWACVQARACMHKFNEMIANRERILNCIAHHSLKEVYLHTLKAPA